MPSNIRIRGGKFNKIEGDLTVIDCSRHETNIESYNMYHNKVTKSYNSNSKKNGEHSHLGSSDYSVTKLLVQLMTIMRAVRWAGCLLVQRQECPYLTFLPDGQRREDYTRPPYFQPQFQSTPHQTSASSHIDNRDSFNIHNNKMDNVLNDYSETHCKYESMQYSSCFLKSV